jgi:hypothetical protein
LLDFVGRPRLRETLLKLFEIVGPDGTTLAAQHDESYWPVELRHLRWCQRARNLFGEAKACNTAALTVALFHVVVDFHVPISKRDGAG